MNKLILSGLFLLILQQTICEEEDFKAARGRVESCPGCSLNRLKDVKTFIYDDVPKYANLEFKKIHGAPPELVILNDSDEEVERIPLASLTREECNHLLLDKGFLLRLADRNRNHIEL